jgi:hypothetical protein
MDEIIKQIYQRRIYHANRAQQDDRSPFALRFAKAVSTSLIYFKFEVFFTDSEFLIEACSMPYKRMHMARILRRG